MTVAPCSTPQTTHGKLQLQLHRHRQYLFTKSLETILLSSHFVSTFCILIAVKMNNMSSLKDTLTASGGTESAGKKAPRSTIAPS